MSDTSELKRLRQTVVDFMCVLEGIMAGFQMREDASPGIIARCKELEQILIKERKKIQEGL